MKMAKPQESSVSVQVELVIQSPQVLQPTNDLSSKSIKHSPFFSTLSNFHAGYFQISLSLCSQALLWKSLGNHHENAIISRRYLLGLTPFTALVFIWSFALLSVTSLSLLYIMKCMFHFDKVKSEFIHCVGVNYLYVPWISCFFLIQSCPFMEPTSVIYLVLCWIFIIPVVILDVKIYGQWFTKGKRYLSSVANPTCLISVIANFAGALAASDMSYMESGLFMFALGFAHYMVLFVTLYQGSEGSSRWIGSSLKPVFFLFFAAPSMASLTWHSLSNSSSFDSISKLLFYLSMFMCLSLVCRPMMFKKSMKKYSVSWWAYSFPLTVLAMNSAEYAHQVKGILPHALMLLLSTVSCLVSLLLVFCTSLDIKDRLLFSSHKNHGYGDNDKMGV